MIPEQRQRAGRAVEARLHDLHSSIPRLAELSGVSARTIRLFIRGERWPDLNTRLELEKALGWRPGEIARRAVGTRALDNVTDMTDAELAELLTVVAAEYTRRHGRPVDQRQRTGQ